MVTLKNNFGVEPDKDSVVMNVSESSSNDAKSTGSGHPKAILICRKNSHPFQSRTLILNTPAKIGRSVARARPSSYNGIFDCKVLSRNHAIIWYEADSGKFMIQDTKSSNGTFVNSQRLSKGGEPSLPWEFFSRDVVQFGVDVLENQRKGNEESGNSDESNHIVTHGCIVATVRLFHPNGKESKSGQPYSTPNPVTPIPQEKICKLELIIHEAQQREGRLHDKLEELQIIIGKLEIACQETLTNRFEETRLLSKIANLEKQTKVMSKVMSGTSGKSSEKVESEIQQLLADIEKVQSVAREIQERQHRKLLESEQKLIEAQRVASNLELEVIALREQANLSELHIQEMGTKCTAYCQTIDILKSNYHAQMELTQKLEARMCKPEEGETERDLKSNASDFSITDKYKFISDENDDQEAHKKEKENSELILESCKFYEEIEKVDENDFINEDNKTEWLTKKFDAIADAMYNGLENISNCMGQLEGALMDVERSKKIIEKLCIRNHALSLELEAAKLPAEEIEKTENDFEGEILKSVSMPPISNEKITELEIDLEENKELLNQARIKQRESEGKYSKLRCELDGTIKKCEKLIVDSSNLRKLLKSHLQSFDYSTDLIKQKILELELNVKDLKNGQGQKPLEVHENSSVSTEVKETQTVLPASVSSSTNTDVILLDKHEPEAVAERSNAEKTETNPNDKSLGEDKSDPKCQPTETYKNGVKNLGMSPLLAFDRRTSQEKGISETNSDEGLGGADIEWSSNNLGAWEKIRKIQSVLSNQLDKETCIPSYEINEMKNLLNLLAEDLVHLLLREQQISKDKQNLQEKLNKTLSQEVVPAVGITMHSRTMVLFSLTAVAAYFIYIVFL